MLFAPPCVGCESVCDDVLIELYIYARYARVYIYVCYDVYIYIQTVTCDSLLFLGTKIFKKKIFLPCKIFLAAVFLSATAWSSCTTLPGSCLRLCDAHCIRVQPVTSCLRVQRFKQTNCVFQTSVLFFSGLA